MNLKQWLILFCLPVTQLWASSTEVKIGVLYGNTINEIYAIQHKGNPKIFFDSLSFFRIDSTFNLKIVADLDSLTIFNNESKIAKCKTVKILEDPKSVTQLKHPNFKNEKYYGGQLHISSNSGFIFALNILTLENYLPGVLEAEVGINRPPEYYKVQAIICRTYTLSHLRRHEMEDFNLCDKEHCQAFKGYSKPGTELQKGVQKTEGIVVVDNDFMLITAAFHANCGGQTVNSEDVWNKKLDYLRSIKDTFCLHEKSAFWTKEFLDDSWIEKMHKVSKEYKHENDSILFVKDFFFTQKTRKKFYDVVPNCLVPLKDMRSILELKSTYFSAENRYGKIILNGRGFGHGVGLCQDGAIKMSKLNYSYKSILHFYFQNVSIVHLDKLDFYKFNE
jgi:stage II sporulation protein D